MREVYAMLDAAVRKRCVLCADNLGLFSGIGEIGSREELAQCLAICL
jgi:hypothetical protein